MKKWLIPLVALILITLIGVSTWAVIKHRTDKSTYEIYFIAVGDNGKKGQKIGCGDSAVPIKRQTVSKTTLSDVYQDLLSTHDYDFSPELKNALWQSQLTLESADITAGIAFITLTGTITQSDKACDAPRIKAQLEDTAKQFNGVKDVQITVNGKLLDEALK